MKHIPFEKIRIGATASMRRRITERDVKLFAKLTGDHNPLHLDEKYAKKTIFKSRIVHGILLVGLISALLATKLPGPGYAYVKQDVRFLKPVRIGDMITVKSRVIKKIKRKKLVKLKTTCVNQKNKEVIDGEAIVKAIL